MTVDRKSGAFGVVLNRRFIPPTTQSSPLAAAKPNALSTESTPVAEVKKQRLHLGGPVSGPVRAVHKAKSMGDVETQPGLFVATQRKHLNRLLKQHRYPFSLFVGHSGDQHKEQNMATVPSNLHKREAHRESGLHHDRITAVLVVVGMLALFGLIIWLASLGPAPSGEYYDYDVWMGP